MNIILILNCKERISSSDMQLPRILCQSICNQNRRWSFIVGTFIMFTLGISFKLYDTLSVLDSYYVIENSKKLLSKAKIWRNISTLPIPTSR